MEKTQGITSATKQPIPWLKSTKNKKKPYRHVIVHKGKQTGDVSDDFYR